MKRATALIDMHKMSEDERIQYMGTLVMENQMTFPVLLDDDGGKKCDRYIAKLKFNFPGIQILERGKHEIPGVEYIIIGPPCPIHGAPEEKQTKQ
jgi:hypothetical protein